jgi:hypothetical protein
MTRRHIPEIFLSHVSHDVALRLRPLFSRVVAAQYTSKYFPRLPLTMSFRPDLRRVVQDMPPPGGFPGVRNSHRIFGIENPIALGHADTKSAVCEKENRWRLYCVRLECQRQESNNICLFRFFV